MALRAAETEARPRAVAAARASLEIWRKSLNAWPAIKPWLDAGEVQELNEAVRPPCMRACFGGWHFGHVMQCLKTRL